MARHKQEFAIYQREMEAAISALEAQYQMDSELAKSAHEAAFRAGVAAARAEGMAIAAADGMTVSMAADAALAAAARAVAAVEGQRAEAAERRAAVAEAALAQIMAVRNHVLALHLRPTPGSPSRLCQSIRPYMWPLSMVRPCRAAGEGDRTGRHR